MRVRSEVLVALIAMSLVGCALSHHATMDGGPRNDARPGDGSLDAADVPRDGADVPIPPPDADGGCPPGTQLCGGTCVPLDAPDHCGSCANDCQMLPGVNRATVTCSAGTCVLAGNCAPGYADCDPGAGGCETVISDATHCGTCTMACSGGTPACSPDGSGGFHCTNGCTVAGQSLCGSTCTDTASDVANCGGCGNACAMHDHASAACAGSACMWTCVPGYHDCGGVCVSDLLPTSCGSSCSPCMPPSNASATCAGGTCGFACNTGFHLCGGACVSDNDVATCGGSCTPCATASNATATCSGGSCGLTCNSGFHACGSASTFLCAADNDATHCGPTCTPCSTPTNGSVACVSGSCSGSCGTGLHLCTGASGATSCEMDNDATHCGSSCVNCTFPANSRPTCVSGTCGFMCNSGFTMSGGSCVMSGPVCGNRVLESGETCDDGNRTGGDGCDNACHMETAIVDSCSDAHTTIAVGDRGVHLYTGSTSGRAGNSPGACVANGPDVIWQVTITVSGAFNYTVSVTPSGWNAVMRQDATCPTNACVVPAVPGTVVSYSGSGTNSTTWNFAADSIDGSSGNFVLSINVP